MLTSEQEKIVKIKQHKDMQYMHWLLWSTNGVRNVFDYHWLRLTIRSIRGWIVSNYSSAWWPLNFKHQSMCSLHRKKCLVSRAASIEGIYIERNQLFLAVVLLGPFLSPFAASWDRQALPAAQREERGRERAKVESKRLRWRGGDEG